MQPSGATATNSAVVKMEPNGANVADVTDMSVDVDTESLRTDISTDLIIRRLLKQGKKVI